MEMWQPLNFINIISGSDPPRSMTISIKRPWLVTCEWEMIIRMLVLRQRL
jgi:hypothetical protein